VAVNRWSFSFGLVWVACLHVSAVSAGERTAIGEKINFSGENGAGLPEQRLDQKQPSRPFEFLDRGNSFGGVTEPILAPPTRSLPKGKPDARLWEQFERRIEQKRNWIYGRPDDWGRQPTLEEMLSREGQADGGAKKSRSGLAAFFEERGGQKDEPSLRRKEKAFDDLNERDAGKNSSFGREYGGRNHSKDESKTSVGFEPERVITAGFGATDGLFNLPSSQGRVADFNSSGRDDFFGQMREQQVRPDEFRKLLGMPLGLNALTPHLDPINLNVDSTRQELNPVTPAGLSTGLPASRAGSLDSLRAVAGPPTRSSLTGIEDSSTRVLGPSSLSPAVAAPGEPRYSQPTPLVLEFPKRKF